MQQLIFHLGMITKVNVKERKIDFVDITIGNNKDVEYKDIKLNDIAEQQTLPQKGYYVLFFIVYTITGRQNEVVPVRYYASNYNGNRPSDVKIATNACVTAPGEQVFISKSGQTSVAIAEKMLGLFAGPQSIVIDNDNSQTKINYNTLQVAGSDGFNITQAQNTDTLTIQKLNEANIPTTQIDISDSTINITTKGLKGVTTIQIKDGVTTIQGQVEIGDTTKIDAQIDALVKRNAFLSHIHSNGNNGAPTGPAIVTSKDPYTNNLKAQ